MNYVAAHELIIDGQPVEKWVLLTNYPKIVYTDINQTLAAAGLCGQCILYVQEDLENDQDAMES